MKLLERIAPGILLTIFAFSAAALAGALITWHAETSMGWEEGRAASAGYQGALLILGAAFGILALKK